MRLVLGLLFCVPAFATLQVTSATLDVTGFILTVQTNSATTLTGSTGNCFTLTGGSFYADPISTAVISGTTVVITPSAPLYGEQTINAAMAASPTCALVGSTGVAAASNANAINSSEWHGAHNAVISAHASYDGSPAFGSSSGIIYPDMVTYNSALGSITVANSGTSAVHIWAWNGSNAYCIQQDGVDAGTRQTTGASGIFTDITLVSGLSGSHTSRILGCAGGAAWQNVFIAAVRFVGGSFTGTPPAIKPILFCFGDSICGAGSAPDDSRQIDSWLDSIAGGYSAQIFPSSGACVSSNSGNCMGSGLETQCAKTVLIGGAAIDVMKFEPGVNDQAASVPTGPGSTFRNAESNMINSCLAQSPAPKHAWVREILPNLDTNFANRAAYAADQQAAAAAAGIGFAHTDGWIDPTIAGCTHDTVDHLHPCGATVESATGIGYAKIANEEAPINAGFETGQSFSVSGPTTGTVGTTSSSFTITIANGATWSGNDSITIGPSAPCGLILPSQGTPGTTVTVTPTAGSTLTFQCRPTAAGSGTITYSGLADLWLAPAANSFTSSNGPTPTFAPIF